LWFKICDISGTAGDLCSPTFYGETDVSMVDVLLKFADDTKVDRVVDSHSDGQSLQADLVNMHCVSKKFPPLNSL